MAEPTSKPVLPTGVLVDGMGVAVGRVKAADWSTSEGYHAVFEALAWVGAVRDRFTDEDRSIPPVLLGLYYLRNLVLHDGADVLLLIPGVGFGEGPFGMGPFGGSPPARVFPPRAELPPPKWTHPTGLSEYDEHVVGGNLVDVLDTVLAEVAQNIS